MTATLLDVQQLLLSLRCWTKEWHDQIVLSELIPLWIAIEQNHCFNFQLWHEEDIARRDDVPAERIRQAKRSIDGFNQQRNNFMEKIDEEILGYLRQGSLCLSQGVLHSESPGMIVDRLSIMALKEFNTHEQLLREDVDSGHRDACVKRLRILQEQQTDLAHCLECLLKQFLNGERMFKVYR